MVLPTRYRTSAQGPIASFSFTDIAEGTGVIAFYGAQTSDGYILTTNSSVGSKVSYIESSGTVLDNQPFDVTFNLPKKMKGNVIVNIPVGRAAGTSGHMSGQVLLYHYDGSTETLIASAEDQTATNAGAELPEKDRYICLQMYVSGQNFKKGDTLRMRLGVSAMNATGYLGFDPLNRNPSNLTEINNTQLKVFTPFEIDQ